MEKAIVIPWTDIASAAAAIFTALILVVAAICAGLEVRHIKSAREAQLLSDLSRRWSEELLQESREAAEKYKDGNQLRQAVENLKEKADKESYILLRLPDFFEDLGLLVSRGCFSTKVAHDLFGTAIKYHYNRYEPVIRYLREKHKDKTIYQFFADLATNVNN